jgi:hypothetical protein
VRSVTNLQHAGLPTDLTNRPFGRPEPLVVALDIEWTKNYREAGQNRMFCYSLVLVPRPATPVPLRLALSRVGFRSFYVDTDDETDQLLTHLDADLAALMVPGNVVVGHQLSTDLAVALANATGDPPAVTAARDAWHQRKNAGTVFDTRYDLNGAFPMGTSRRLVDLCTDAGLDVHQPELTGSSMTALHRRFLAGGDDTIHERLATLNLRHSLSTAALALVGLGLAHLEPLNVNAVLRDHLWDHLGYIDSPAFDALVQC